MKKFNIPTQYKSSIIQEIKEKRNKADRLKRDFSPTYIERDKVTFVLARHFGFCYGVENAVEKIYQTLEENPDKDVYLLSQMIHNPIVNDDLASRGIKFIMDTYGNQLIDWSEITKNDIVVTPAFGTTVEIEKQLIEKGLDLKTFDTTCPFVEKVWKRSSKLASQDHTIIIHGKEKHEETRATFSHSKSYGKAIIVRDIDDAKTLGDFILSDGSQNAFEKVYGDKMSENMLLATDFDKVGVVNQTTMLASETQEIAQYFKTVMEQKYGVDEIKNHFADTRDTLCYATNDNQSATLALMEEEADLAIVVGGYNSSNTTHLVELLEQKYKTYFISTADKIIDKSSIESFDYKTKSSAIVPFLEETNTKKKIIVTCGASCPDSVMEAVITKLDAILN